METLIIIGALALLVLIILRMAVRIVPEYRRLVVFRLGRSMGAWGPGLVLLIPFVDRGVSVDLRESFFDVPPQTCITADNASVSIDFLVYDKVVDPVRSVLEVENFTGAARGLAITTLRAVVGAMLLDDVLSKRDEINNILHEKLDEVTDRWGVRVTAVEIREVVPPRQIEEAMTRQMAAERTRRATVTEAEGQREATVQVAEGEKRATVLRAEGQREATILQAQADREAARLRAEGAAMALAEIYRVAQGVDSKTLTLQYLDALRALGATPATKFVIPTEFLGLARQLVNHAHEAVAQPDGEG
ncbi:MAG TPA: SPFH/Band 7/PHB domain protein [Chloroflexi bacterium]|jgi:regulator of protease activity HflC (stomatin/prohibitin superfamily)|nr:SPFH/Band 7/PHB domain protein [Chloroflexota bacterium]